MPWFTHNTINALVHLNDEELHGATSSVALYVRLSCCCTQDFVSLTLEGTNRCLSTLNGQMHKLTKF